MADEIASYVKSLITRDPTLVSFHFPDMFLSRETFLSPHSTNYRNIDPSLGESVSRD